MYIPTLDSFNSVYRFATCYSAYELTTLSGVPAFYGWDVSSEDAVYYGPLEYHFRVLEADRDFQRAGRETFVNFLNLKQVLPSTTSAMNLRLLAIGLCIDFLRKEGIKFVLLVGSEVSLDRLVQL